MSRVIAIVGRPNVGKSALFNRIAGRRIAIVHDQPGVTRDRISAEVEWRGQPFSLIDTGGLGLALGEKARETIAAAALEQVKIAIDSAGLILFLVDAQQGVVGLDRDVAAHLRRHDKPVIVVANKADRPKLEAQADEFTELGFDRVIPVSAIHGHGIERLLKTALALLACVSPSADRPEAAAPGGEPLNLAIVGRPNVGKSSLVNALTRSERVIVSPTPGTTRDSIDVPFEIETNGVRRRCVLIDTAGIRKERRLNDSIEFFSVRRAEGAIDRADLVVFMLDAQSGILEQDKKIADKIVTARKACVIVVNKWDLFKQTVDDARKDQLTRRREHRDTAGVSQPPATLVEFARFVQRTLFFLDYAPVIFASATSGFNLTRILEAIRYVADQLRQTIPTALLNRTLREAIERRPPSSAQGHWLKFFYATQTQHAPTTFVLFVNRPELLSEAYGKYLVRHLRRAFGFEGCPIVLTARPRPRTVQPVRAVSFRSGRRARTD